MDNVREKQSGMCLNKKTLFYMAKKLEIINLKNQSIIDTLSRLGAMASISSMKMIAGACFSASSKACLKLLSDSLGSLLTISGPFIKWK